MRYDFSDSQQLTAAGVYFFAVFIEEFDAQGGGCAGAAVDGGASTDGKENFLCPVVYSSIYKLARTVGSGFVRVSLMWAEQFKAAGGSHFHKCGFVLGEPGEASVDLHIGQRAGNGFLNPGTAGGGH